MNSPFFVSRVVQAFDRYQVSYLLVGGYAVSLHGAVRGTKNVDLVISLTRNSFIDAERALKSLGLVSRLPVSAEQVFDFREEFVKNKQLFSWEFYHPHRDFERVDLSLVHDFKNFEVKVVHALGLNYKIASIGDLIKIKSATGRPQDQADADALIRIDRASQEFQAGRRPL